MIAGQKPLASKADPSFYCTEHQTPWFKRGKMKNYAHPIGDTKEWCNMPPQRPLDIAQSASEPAVAHHNDSQAETPPVARPGAQGYGEQLKAFYDRAHTELGMDVVAVNTVAKAKGVDLGKPTTDLRAFWVELTAEKEGKA